MKRIPLAAAALTVALLASPGVAYATSSPGGAAGAGGSGSSNGSAGQPGASNSNCAGAIAIVIKWFGWAGPISQCNH